MTTPARVIWGVALLLILGAAFVYRMGRHDVQALADFAASYEQFDKRVSEDNTFTSCSRTPSQRPPSRGGSPTLDQWIAGHPCLVKMSTQQGANEDERRHDLCEYAGSYRTRPSNQRVSTAARVTAIPAKPATVNRYPITRRDSAAVTLLISVDWLRPCSPDESTLLGGCPSARSCYRTVNGVLNLPSRR